MTSAVRALSGIPREELAGLLSTFPRYRSVQIFKWIASGACSFDEMNNLPLGLREELKQKYLIRSSKVEERLDDRDGTVKLKILLEDGTGIESVLLSDGKNRRTACLSTQAGCQAGCVFCKTGTLGFHRNLSAAEIVEQFLFLREIASDTEKGISNIVVMGMGEPLFNLENLRRAVAVIGDEQGINFSKRRITVSTCGICKGITDLADRGPKLRLALSLNTADEELRRRLMPISVGQSLASIKKALARFQSSGGGRVTLELVLLSGINTRAQDAAALVEFARGLDAAVNLIPWNPFENPPAFEPPLKEPGQSEINDFKSRLESLGLNVTCRYRKGRNICGACGQLGSISESTNSLAPENCRLESPG
jgi:23S rRNA (adenine2503-C2)-methyltransferase